ncbi:unnamed protein product [Didymodactylos carnosus]|uniref:Uncharacterized protein n=1 Tax=Didymodactylos carnosus TaxID=1234261 RepID=A0A8S2CVI8_9BILA|nr:unnamed protein product [Didymodactylos carnosus]CAF3598583.1 unnamed protein product [Didymodactylos carnosus]
MMNHTAMVPTTPVSSSEDLLFARWLPSRLDDVSLFESIRLIMNSELQNKDYRNLCSELIEKNSAPVIDDVPREKYCETIKQKDYLGGAIDLDALATHLKIDFRLLIVEDKRVIALASSGSHLNTEEFAYILKLHGCDRVLYHPLVLVKSNSDCVAKFSKYEYSVKYLDQILQSTFVAKIHSSSDGIIPTVTCSNETLEKHSDELAQNNLLQYLIVDDTQVNGIIHEHYLSSHNSLTTPYTDLVIMDMISKATSPFNYNSAFEDRQTNLELKLTTLLEIVKHGKIVNDTVPVDERHVGARYVAELGLDGTDATGAFQCVQSGSHQRSYPGTITPEMEGLHMEAMLCTHDEKEHPFGILAEHAKKDTHDEVVIQPHPDVNASKNKKSVHYRITPKDCADKLKRYPMKIPKAKLQHPFLTRKIMIDDRLKLARLAFRLCKELNGNFVPVSQTTYSDLIELGFGDPKPGEIKIKQLCKNGGEVIEIPFTGGTIAKTDFEVILNDRRLRNIDFKIPNKTITFKSPAQTEPEQKSLHIVVRKENSYESVMQKGVIYDVALDVNIPYV